MNDLHISKVIAKEHLLNAFSIWGIEGTLEKIDDLYQNCPGIRKVFLEVYQEMTMAEEKKLQENERFCFKCKKVVDKTDFNSYYKICDKCVNKSTGH